MQPIPIPDNQKLATVSTNAAPRPTAITVRPPRLDDLLLVAGMLSRLSDQTRYLRYFHPLPGSLPWAMIEAVRLISADGTERITLLATAQRGSDTDVLGVAELVRPTDAGARWGEVAVLVRDDMQRQGIGGALMQRVVELARTAGLTALYADVLSHNQAALHLLRRLGLPFTLGLEDGRYRVTLHLADPALLEK